MTPCPKCGYAPEVGHRVKPYQDGHLSLDFDRREVRVAGVLKPLTLIEYALLALLVRYRGKVLSHDALVSTVWGPDYSTLGLAKWHISHLRRKLGDSAKERIVTVHGFGYRYEPPVRGCSHD